MNKLFILILSLMSVNLVSQENIDFRSVLQFNVKMSDVWGYSDTSGKEYALCGLTTGVSIVDVSNPDSIFELFYIPGDTSIWRDLKTWAGYAYVTNEKGGGLMIIDLNHLPNSISFSNWTGGLLKLLTAHNLYIDKNGIAYIFGPNVWNGGVVMLDLANPKNPQFLGAYSSHYVHDGFVRGDTLYTAEIRRGEFAVIDVSDKANPLTLASQQTPGRFTHNVWLSDNGKYLFTTDEIAGASVAAFDISDLSDIQLLDEYRSNPGDSTVPHNTHFFNKYLVTSYYRDGVTIVDAHDPTNLVEIGNYDTDPRPSAPGFQGCWGVYPWLPSGNILASDRNEGLFVLTPTYTRACYLEGVVTDLQNGLIVPQVVVEIIGDNAKAITKISGQYALGIGDSAYYDIRFSKSGCKTLIVSNVKLEKEVTVKLDAVLDCSNTTSIESLTESGILVYPTLTDNAVTIEFRSTSSVLKGFARILSIDGRVIKSQELVLPMTKINGLKHLPIGNYLVQVQTENETKIFRIVKQ